MRAVPARPPRRRSNRRLLIAGGIAVAGVIILGLVATFYTDLLWFREVGFGDVFWTQIRTKVFLGVIFGLAFTALLIANLWVVQKLTSPHRLFSMEDSAIERYRASLRPYVRLGVLGVSLLFGLFAGSGATGQWRSWLLYRNGVSFGSTDPIFGKDLSFYVFQLPFHRFVFAWLFSTLLVLTIITAAAHYFMGGIRLDQRGAKATPQVKAHISVLLGLIVLLKAWGYRLDQFGLLFSPRGTVTGASYTDVNAQKPALTLLIVVAIVVAVLFFVNIRVRGWAIPVVGTGLLLLTSLIVGGAYPALVQRLRVTPVERIREKPFIERNIAATRTAFGIDKVQVKAFPGETRIDQNMLRRNTGTVENIRLWAPDILEDVYGQLQRIRQYYEFLDVDVDRYSIAGRKRQLMLSAREMSQTSLPDRARSWINTHLIYTHGNGVAASRVNSSTTQGQPDIVVGNVPPETVPGMVKPTNSRIYFGEAGDETPYIVVNSGVQELDFPTEDPKLGKNSYDGKGGIELSSAMRRWAFAWRFRDANLFLSSAVKPDSRILFRRHVRDRVRQVAPFLKLDHDPYIVLTSAGYVWVQDAYTTTNMYPYSERVNLADVSGPLALTGEANYIRNSVKVTVNANDGTVNLYVFDPLDPIVRSWQKVFPGSFKPVEEAPAEVREHFRYPEDLLSTQAALYTIYHMTDADDFYSREDAWELPEDTRTSGQIQPPYYVLMRLPGEKNEEFILFTQFTPRRRQNLTAWLAARSDAPRYGELISFVLPKQKNVVGPRQVKAQINSDPIFSPLQSLLSSGNSQVLYGNLLTIPIENSFLYVQPIYVLGQGSSLPELKKVVVVAGETVKVGDTLAEALALLTGAAPPQQEPGQPPSEATLADLIAEAIRHYNAAQDALKVGDFAAYGREQAAMKAALDRAARVSGAEPQPTTSPSPTSSPR